MRRPNPLFQLNDFDPRKGAGLPNSSTIELNEKRIRAIIREELKDFFSSMSNDPVVEQAIRKATIAALEDRVRRLKEEE